MLETDFNLVLKFGNYGTMLYLIVVFLNPKVVDLVSVPATVNCILILFMAALLKMHMTVVGMSSHVASFTWLVEK